MLTDIQIAQAAEMDHILKIANKIGLTEEDIEFYGKYKAKISQKAVNEAKQNEKNGKLILVTAISPTPMGEGKTTTSIGLGDAMAKIDKNVMICIREPSLGPVFGVKGGAAGGGYAQVVPMEDINLHFTGDLHAITAANNLLCAMIDNSLYQGNPLNIDPKRVVFRRCMDMNDRQLRNIIGGLGSHTDGELREDGFDITAASEVMATLCMADGIEDLKARLARIVVGYTYDRQPVTAGDINAHGAMAALLREALLPNLVQTLEHTPTLVHGGPFANIAHGCNTVTATKYALKKADYVVTEAGFGADLGAEKFLDIKCRIAGLEPSAVVIVATIRGLKYHGGIKKDELVGENIEALTKGFENLAQHIANVKNVYKLPAVVAVNRFPTDTEAEVNALIKLCEENGARVSLSEVFAKGGDGAIDLAHKVVAACEEESKLEFAYDLEASIEDKIRAVAEKIYHADGVVFTKEAQSQIKTLTKLGYDKIPVCIAKTQYSFSDNQNLLGAPRGFEVTVREAKVSAGAGFIVALTGEIMKMPGLPKVPAAEKIDIDENGVIKGLF